MRLSAGLWKSRSGQTRERLGNFTRVWKDGGSKGDLQIDGWQHTEGCFTASVTRETQVQMTQHFTPTGRLESESQAATSGGEDVEKSDLQRCCYMISFIEM